MNWTLEDAATWPLETRVLVERALELDVRVEVFKPEELTLADDVNPFFVLPDGDIATLDEKLSDNGLIEGLVIAATVARDRHSARALIVGRRHFLQLYQRALQTQSLSTLGLAGDATPIPVLLGVPVYLGLKDEPF